MDGCGRCMSVVCHGLPLQATARREPQRSPERKATDRHPCFAAADVCANCLRLCITCSVLSPTPAPGNLSLNSNSTSHPPPPPAYRQNYYPLLLSPCRNVYPASPPSPPCRRPTLSRQVTHSPSPSGVYNCCKFATAREQVPQWSSWHCGRRHGRLLVLLPDGHEVGNSQIPSRAVHAVDLQWQRCAQIAGRAWRRSRKSPRDRTEGPPRPL